MTLLRPSGFVVPHTRAECPHCHERIDTTYSKYRGSWRIRVHYIVISGRWGGIEGAECSGSRLIIEDYYQNNKMPEMPND